VRVALAAVSAFAEQKPLPWLREIDNRFVLDFISLVLPGTANDCANWDFHDGRFGAAAVLVLSFAVAAAFRANQGLEKQGDQTRRIMIRFQNDIPAPAAITAIGTAMRDEFFPSETGAPVAAIAGFGMNADLVDKLHLQKVPAALCQVESELSPRWRAQLIGDIYSPV
jgi:hypothetical protein